jgi:hypothetical protein
VDQTLDAELKAYLRRFRWALAALPERDREEIVEETRVHVLARIDQGQSPGQALAAFGAAETYARRFIDEMEISDALASQSPSRVLSVVLKRVHRSVAAALAFLAVLVLVIFAVGGVGAALIKPFDPDHVGLWVSAHGDFFFGQSEAEGGRHELLGLWLYPLVILDVAVVWFTARVILLGAVRTLARKD